MIIDAGPVLRPDARNGIRVAAVTGLIAALWGSAGLTGGSRDLVRIVAVVAALVLLKCAGQGGGPIVRSVIDRTIVVAEVAAAVGGAFALGVDGSRFLPAWCAAVLAVHVLILCRRVDRHHRALGVALLGCAAATVVVGAVRGGQRPTEAFCGVAVCVLGGGLAVGRGV